MSWIGWVAIVIGCIIAIDVLFIAVIVTIDMVNERKWRRDQRKRSNR